MKNYAIKNLPLYCDIIDILVNDVGYQWKFHPGIESYGQMMPLEKHIYFHPNLITLDDDQFWSTVFHEYAHAVCDRLDILPDYHHKHLALSSRVQALEAELEVDNIATHIMKRWFPDLKYSSGYPDIANQVVKDVNSFNKKLKKGKK